MAKFLSVVALFLAIYGFHLNYPSYPYFDEVFFVPAAQDIVHLSAYSETTHPPLGKLLIALSIRVFGDTPWAWRLPSLICAAVATTLCGYLAFLLSGQARMFWLVCVLLFCDGLWITQGRCALLNSPMVCLILATLVFWWQGHKNTSKQKIFWIAAAVCLGLAMACKWQGGLVILIPALFYYFSKAQRIVPRWWLYILIAAVAYLSTFLIIPFIHGMHWSDILSLQAKIPEHHLNEPSHMNRYDSRWYTWPFLIRPIWYGFLRHNPDLNLQYQTVDGILCIGNPFIFMLIMPAIIWGISHYLRKKDPFLLVALTGFFVFWLPSGMLSRYTLFHHFYPAFPFAVMAIAAMLDHMWQSDREVLQAVVGVLLVMIILGWVFFYPLWTGMTISDIFYRQHLWIPLWK